MACKRKSFFVAGSLLIILSITLSSYGFYTYSEIEYWHGQEEIWFSNWEQNIRLQNSAQTNLDMASLIQEITSLSPKIEQYKNEANNDLRRSIIHRYRMVYHKDPPMQFISDLSEMNFKELEKVNNEYAEVSRKQQNVIADRINELNPRFGWMTYLSILVNITGLLLVLFADVGNH